MVLLVFARHADVVRATVIAGHGRDPLVTFQFHEETAVTATELHSASFFQVIRSRRFKRRLSLLTLPGVRLALQQSQPLRLSMWARFVFANSMLTSMSGPGT